MPLSTTTPVPVPVPVRTSSSTDIETKTTVTTATSSSVSPSPSLPVAVTNATTTVALPAVVPAKTPVVSAPLTFSPKAASSYDQRRNDLEQKKFNAALKVKEASLVRSAIKCLQTVQLLLCSVFVAGLSMKAGCSCFVRLSLHVQCIVNDPLLHYSGTGKM